MRRTAKNLTRQAVSAAALSYRAGEIEVTIHLTRYHARGESLLAAVSARLPEPGSALVPEVARSAALCELTALSARGVRTFGPDEGPRPR